MTFINVQQEYIRVINIYSVKHGHYFSTTLNFICKLKSEQPVSYHHKLNRNFHAYHLDLLIYQKYLDLHSICGVNISSDSCQLLLPVSVFILLMWLTQPIAHIQGRVVMGNDKQ
jgi:hypothetical protein